MGKVRRWRLNPGLATTKQHVIPCNLSSVFFTFQEDYSLFTKGVFCFVLFWVEEN